MSAKTFSFYDTVTGMLIDRRFRGIEEHVAANTPAGHAAIEGTHDHLSQRIDVDRFNADQEAALAEHDADVARGRKPAAPFAFSPQPHHVVDYQPPQPSIEHEWNADTKRWQLTAAVQQRESDRRSALARIAELEGKQARAVREAVLSGDQSRLRAIEGEIAGLRPTL
jgi:hypothetical protein